MLDLLISHEAPKLAKELNTTIENILENISNEKEVNPFELQMTIAKKEQKVIASIVQPDGTELDAIDAGLLFEDLIRSKMHQINGIRRNRRPHEYTS
jgi:hypothetical protein